METGKSQGAPNGRKRRPKQPYSDEFHHCMDLARSLSVAERVELIRALAGKQGLLVSNPKAPTTTNGSQGSGGPSGKPSKPAAPENPVRESPEANALQKAKEAVRAKKAELGVDQLDRNGPEMSALHAALEAYKVVHSAAVAKEPPEIQAVRAQTGAPQRGAKRQASKSPERGQTMSATLAGVAAKFARGLGATAARKQSASVLDPKSSGQNPEGDNKMEEEDGENNVL